MISKKGRVVAAIAFFLALITSSQALAAINYTVEFRDHYGLSGGLESSYISSGVPGYNLQGERLCSSLSDPACSVSASIFAILPYCQLAAEQNCVESLSISTPQLPSSQGKYLRTVGVKAFEADPLNGIPAGTNWSLFEIPTLKNAGIHATYGVKVRVEFQKIPFIGVKATSFSAVVTGYELGTTTAADGLLSNYQNPLGLSSIRGTGGDPTCLWVKSGECGREVAFPSDLTISLKVHIGNYLTSWLHGRIADPVVGISQLDQRQNLLTITGKPVKVPGVKGAVTSEVIPGKTPLQSGTAMKIDSSQDRSLEQFLEFEKYFQPKATVLDEVWSVRSLGVEAVASAAAETVGISNPLGAISSIFGGGGSAVPTNPLATGGKSIAELTGLGSSAAKCVPDATAIVGAILGSSSISSLIGLVTTNSLTYAPGPPKFEEGFLKYQVAGLHKNPDDSIFQGSYDLIMSGKIARCIYGFEGSAPLYATVSVVSSSGGETILATETVKEENGWLRLKARGFTFSSPTLKIKLTQAAPAEVTKPAAPAEVTKPAAPAEVTKPADGSVLNSTSKVSAKISITCVKGKLVKKVSGTTPKCPAGYKNKKG